MPLAQPSRPRSQAAEPVGVLKGTSTLTTFQVASEASRAATSQSRWASPMSFLPTWGLSGRPLGLR